jgi:aspartyl/asparaginyl beta-hydroxylase (cupin superfamily)
MTIKPNLILRIVLYSALIYFFPKTSAFFIVCGLVDCTRNRPLNTWLFYNYFFGKGTLTWLLSPINLVADLLTLSWRCRIKTSELPKDIQSEIDHLLENLPKEKLIFELNQQLKDNPRGMIFFKWYGSNKDNGLNIPEFHYPYKYIQTIGVSTFNKNTSTSRHFGPLRFTYRLLYNLVPKKDNGIYIETSNHNHYWHDDPLFIFDDTYVHQSFNQSDDLRYCLFVDFIRPSRFSFQILLKATQLVHWLLKSQSFIFYKNWKNLG